MTQGERATPVSSGSSAGSGPLPRRQVAGPFPALRVAGILLTVSGGLAILEGLLLLATATLDAAVLFAVLVHIAVGVCQLHVGQELPRLQPPPRAGAVGTAVAGILVTLLLIPRGSGSMLVEVLLPLVVIGLVARRNGRRRPPGSRSAGRKTVRP